MKYAVLILCCYFIGGFPTAMLIGKWKGVDVRKSGSGNPGTTNALRTMGKTAGILTFVGDFIKGVLAYFLCAYFLQGDTLSPLIPASFAVLGHCYSPYLKFRGGKGVATACGVGICFVPPILLLALAVFFTLAFVTGIVSLGSVVSVLVAGILVTVMHPLTLSTYFFWGIILLIIWRHRANIIRLCKGEEASFRKKK